MAVSAAPSPLPDRAPEAKAGAAAVYEFGNGVRVHRADLMAVQLQRYAMDGNPNLHEPVEEEWMLRAFATDPPARPVFLDIGAAVGYYAILIKSRWPTARVIAVDALTRHLAALRANAALNGLPDDALETLEVAVGPGEAVRSFVDIGFGSAFAEATPAARRPGARLLDVRTRPLSALLAGLPTVHLMKMDIQGAELEVLAAARAELAAGRVRQALVGTHGKALHAGVRSLLQDCGFRILFDDPAPAMQPDGIVLARHG
ncbi:MAG: FkbM family methyltransferase [Caldimonas sp.]